MSGYALAAVTSVTTSGHRYVNGYSYQGAPATSTTNTYAWYDGAALAQVDYTRSGALAA